MSKTESVVRIFVAGLFMFLVSILFILLMIPLLPWRVIRIKACNIYGSVVGKTMVVASGAKVVFHNRSKVDPQKPAILVSNHTSTLDMWIGMWVCPMGGCGLAKKRFATFPASVSSTCSRVIP